MVNFDLDRCLKIVPNKYELILLAKARANEIFAGSQSCVEKYAHEKPFFTALKEISENIYSYDDLNDKTMRTLKNEMFGIYAENSRTSIDKFDESSIFAQSFLGIDKQDQEQIDFENISSGQDESSFENVTDVYEDILDENLMDFSDGNEIFENDDFDK